jgi:ribosomal protein S18 acetylase RimI-like enzyme
MLTIIPGETDLVRELILEYASGTGVDLSFQNFQDEIATLQTFYEATWLAFVDGKPAGCVALRRLDGETCEMKRLYVRTQFRGQNIGHALALHIIDEARGRGYRRMRLDTLPAMTTALKLYRSLGFVEIDPYRFNPYEGSVFMELTIRK